MNQEPEFPQIGKRMTYKVPEGFFERITEKTLKEAGRREQMRHRTLLFRRLSGIAALFILLVTAGFWFINRIHQPEQTVSQLREERKVDQPSPEISNPVETEDTSVQSPATLFLPDSSYLEEFGEEPLDVVLAALTDEELILLATQNEADIFMEENESRQQ